MFSFWGLYWTAPHLYSFLIAPEHGFRATVCYSAQWYGHGSCGKAMAFFIYSKLFELDPALRPLFPEDLSEQKEKLMKMISLAVEGLTDLGALVPKVEELGRRHATYYKVTPPM